MADASGAAAAVMLDVEKFFEDYIEDFPPREMCLWSRAQIKAAIEGETLLKHASITSRNAACLCGSGKKFKHCHGQWDLLP